MSIVCIGSAHGSPGVTTTCLALVGVWASKRRVLLAEADSSGGVLAARFALRDRPGLTSLAAASRHGWTDEAVWASSQELPGGARVLVAPPTSEQVDSVLRDTAEGLARWAGAASDTDMVVDCGRLPSSPPSIELLRAASMVWLVTRPSVDMLRPAAARAAALSKLGVNAELILVGGRPYGPSDVQAEFGVAVLGVVAEDSAAAAALAGRGSARGFRRSLLVRSVATLVESATARMGGGE